jgi:hypothetical protein
MPDPVVYPAWEHTSSSRIPTRSYFYHLPPLAVGTPHVESLTSYLVRLAEAHDISAGVLLTQELLPKVREAFRRHAYQANGKIESTFVYEAHTLNGLSQRSHDWVNVLENLTGVRGLHYLTMRPWSQVVSERGLLRHHRAWCPACLEDWRCSDRPVYEPLLWAMGEVSACSVHHSLLEDRCPHCGRQQHVISAKSRPGHCCRCRRWLGRKSVPDMSNEGRAKVMAASSIGELLSAASKLVHAPSREHFVQNLRFCIEDLAAGNMSRFAVATGVSFDAMFDWFTPGRLVRLNLLSRVCALVGVSPLRFFSKRLTVDDLDCEHVRKVIGQKTSHTRVRRNMLQLRSALERAANSGTAISLRKVADELGYKRLQSLRRRDPVLCDRICGKRERREVVPGTPQSARAFPSKKVIEKALATALLKPVPPSLKTITRYLGFRSDSSLYVRFPDLCSAFATKNALSRQRQVDACRGQVAAAAEETPPPTLREVASRIGRTVSSLQYHYPDLCAKLMARLPERKLLRREQQRAAIQTALAEEPAPSMKSVAVNVGITAHHLRTLHPDLYAHLRKRYDALKSQMASNKRATFRSEIRAAVIDLNQRGMHPSRRRVFAFIDNPSLKSTAILDRQIVATLLELKATSGVLSPDGRDTNPVRSAGNHPLAAQKWNHDLAETAIGWS